MKIIVLFLIIFLLGGCENVEELKEVPFPDNSIIVTPYPTINIEHQNKYHYDSFFHDEDFYVENNACLVDDYFIVNIGYMDEKIVVLEIGGHCFDQGDYNYGVVIVPLEQLESYPRVEYDGLGKLYYQFPEGFTPSNYLDFIDYSYKLAEY